MLAIPVDIVVTNFVSLISVQSTKSSLTPLLLLSPKSLTTYREPRKIFVVLPECRSCLCFFNGVVSLVSVRKVLAEYPIQPVIQLLIGKTKSRYTETSKIGGSIALASK